MPSIFTHLLIAEKSLQRLGPGGPAVLLSSHARVFFLGNLAPDFPYFGSLVDYRGLRLGGGLSAVGNQMEATLARLAGLGRPPAPAGWEERFHRPDSGDLVRGWLERVRLRDGLDGRPAAVACLLAGMFCHVVVDETFHPLVEALTGHPASYRGQRLHRDLEIRLDYAFLERAGFDAAGSGLKTQLERYFGHWRSRQEWFPEWLGREWRGLAGETGERFEKWLEGFWRAQAFLEHPLSPMAEGRRAHLKAAASGARPEGWESLMGRFDRAVEACVGHLRRELGGFFAGEEDHEAGDQAALRR